MYVYERFVFQMHNEQKDACDGMIDEKNKLINELQQVGGGVLD